MKKLIIVLLLVSSSGFAQDNWGPSTSIPDDSLWNICGTMPLYGADQTVISSNESLMVFYAWCAVDPGLALSIFQNGIWQTPTGIDVGFDLYPGTDLFLYESQDTILYFTYNDDIWTVEYSDGIWQNVAALDTIINSNSMEVSPSLPDDGSRLYFQRDSLLMYSEIINGQYMTPVALPSQINSSLNEGWPRISRNGQRLYFNRCYNMWDHAYLYVSYNLNSIWQNPIRLNENINIETMNPNCPMVHGMSFGPCFNSDETRMYFNFSLPYGEFCEPGVDCLVSELITATDNDPINRPDQMTLSVYPNPFNNEIVIVLDGNTGKQTELTIYDIGGRRIRTILSNGHTYWDATDYDGNPVGSGIYFIRVNSVLYSKSVKITYLK